MRALKAAILMFVLVPCLYMSAFYATATYLMHDDEGDYELYSPVFQVAGRDLPTWADGFFSVATWIDMRIPHRPGRSDR